jgi:hypothetical protein
MNQEDKGKEKSNDKKDSSPGNESLYVRIGGDGSISDLID